MANNRNPSHTFGLAPEFTGATSRSPTAAVGVHGRRLRLHGGADGDVADLDVVRLLDGEGDGAGHRLGSDREFVHSTADLVADDVDARDVILLIGWLSRIDEAESDVRAHHLLTIVVDGLRRQE